MKNLLTYFAALHLRELFEHYKFIGQHRRMVGLSAEDYVIALELYVESGVLRTHFAYNPAKDLFDEKNKYRFESLWSPELKQRMSGVMKVLFADRLDHLTGIKVGAAKLAKKKTDIESYEACKDFYNEIESLPDTKRHQEFEAGYQSMAEARERREDDQSYKDSGFR